MMIGTGGSRSLKKKNNERRGIISSLFHITAFSRKFIFVESLLNAALIDRGGEKMGYKTQNVGLRLSEKMMSRLKTLSQQEEKTISELIREAIELYLEKMEEKKNR